MIMMMMMVCFKRLIKSILDEKIRVLNKNNDDDGDDGLF